MDRLARTTLFEDIQWSRGRARFEDGAIVVDPATLRDYSVLKEGMDAPWKLGAIRQPQDAVDFVRRFGLLRHGRGTELREPWGLWEEAALHMHTILVTVTELRAAGWGDDPEATEYIRKLTSGVEWTSFWQAAARDDRERRVQVGVWVAEQVSAGLAGLQWRLRTEAESFGGDRGAPDLFVYSPRSASLLGWIYYRLSQELISGKPMRRCEGCGVMFLVHDQRQRYHDKQCAQRARYHRAAEKRRQP